MASEKSYVTTPLKREVVVELENLREDIWEAKIIYAKRVHMVGKFQGKNHAFEGARKKAEQVADAPAQTGQGIARKPRKKKNEDLRADTPH